MFREGDIVSKDVGECLIPVLAFEWCGAIEHLIDQYAERPPIHSACMSASFDDFGSNVFFCSNKAVGSKVGYARFCVDGRETATTDGAIPADDHGRSAARAGLFGEIEIRKHYMSGLMEEDVYEVGEVSAGSR